MARTHPCHRFRAHLSHRIQAFAPTVDGTAVDAVTVRRRSRGVGSGLTAWHLAREERGATVALLVLGPVIWGAVFTRNDPHDLRSDRDNPA